MKDDQYWIQIQQIADLAKWIEQSESKSDIINKTIQTLNYIPRSIVFPSFNPLVLYYEKHYDCYVVASAEVKALWKSTATFIDTLADLPELADLCLALDEYLTYADTEQDQRDRLAELKASTQGYVITTLQDYKNTAPHKRSQIEATTHQEKHKFVVIDQNLWDKNSQQNWQNYIYMIENHANLIVLGPEIRRTMYFKQLAKYASDLSGMDYVIQKNLMYRGFYKKHYEHIIAMRFP